MNLTRKTPKHVNSTFLLWFATPFQSPKPSNLTPTFRLISDWCIRIDRLTEASSRVSSSWDFKSWNSSKVTKMGFLGMATYATSTTRPDWTPFALTSKGNTRKWNRVSKQWEGTKGWMVLHGFVSFSFALWVCLCCGCQLWIYCWFAMLFMSNALMLYVRFWKVSKYSCMTNLYRTLRFALLTVICWVDRLTSLSHCSKYKPLSSCSKPRTWPTASSSSCWLIRLNLFTIIWTICFLSRRLCATSISHDSNNFKWARLHVALFPIHNDCTLCILCSYYLLGIWRPLFWALFRAVRLTP